MRGTRATAAVIGSATLAMISALVVTAPANATATTIVADWQLNEGPGARVMADSSGHGIDGRIGTLVETGRRVQGATAYHWNYVRPKSAPPNPERLVQVDSSALNPGSSEYAVQMRFRATAGNGNILQKGQSGTRGGFFKIELHLGKLACVYRGTVRQRGLWSATKLNDGAWHTIRCARDSDAVVLTVDGAVKRLKGWTGPVANTYPLTIGGKIACNEANVGCDYFTGDVDWVRIQSG